MCDAHEIEEIELSLTLPEIYEEAVSVSKYYTIPEKSKKIYEKLYAQFMMWRHFKNITSFSESVLLVYFEHLSSKMKPPSLWTFFSMLKCTLMIKHRVDISQYKKLYALLKQKSEGYKGKKSKTFSPSDIKTFLNDAPDEKYLLTKVALIFGVMGACRRHELHDLKLENVKDLGSTILVTIPNRKSNALRTFTVAGKYCELCKSYMKLRPPSCRTLSFFVNYLNGRCTVQNVGINKFGNMGKEIASYLNLPDPDLYTGHCFRRSSSTVLVDADGDITTLKRRDGWRSSTAEAYEDLPKGEREGEPFLEHCVYFEWNNLSKLTKILENIDFCKNKNCGSCR